MKCQTLSENSRYKLWPGKIQQCVEVTVKQLSKETNIECTLLIAVGHSPAPLSPQDLAQLLLHIGAGTG